ncbi:MAG TPA: hypothetical protein VHT23_12410 [Gemmatimonadaceae bacterium]|nr:hypothetical protein [Gemmatimonadaceae bacterium]
MPETHMADAAWHAVAAGLVAPIIGIAFAALLDWLPHFRGQEYATVRHMSHRCIEGLLGGAIEGFAVTLIIAGISIV